MNYSVKNDLHHNEQHDKDRLISCVGIDELQHVCYPESGTTICGVNIKFKKILRDDWQRYACGHCDIY